MITTTKKGHSVNQQLKMLQENPKPLRCLIVWQSFYSVSFERAEKKNAIKIYWALPK